MGQRVFATGQGTDSEAGYHNNQKTESSVTSQRGLEAPSGPGIVFVTLRGTLIPFSLIVGTGTLHEWIFAQGSSRRGRWSWDRRRVSDDGGCCGVGAETEAEAGGSRRRYHRPTGRSKVG
jgi:hypothetical protein